MEPGGGTYETDIAVRYGIALNPSMLTGTDRRPERREA